MAFGITSTVTPPFTIAGAKLQSYTHGPYAPQSAELTDEFGNATARTFYGNGDIVEHEAVYALMCGFAATSVVIGTNGLESVAISTSNGDWPTMTVKWYTGLPSCQSGCTFAVTIPGVEGKRKAQALGLTNSGGKVQSSSWTASASLSLLLDEEGDPAAYAFSGGTIEASGEAVGGTWSAATGMTLSSGPTDSESNTAYATTSANAQGILVGAEYTPST